jgi:hypothetical protein
VNRRLLGFLAAFTILLMVLPPLFDTFDYWDKTPEIPIVGHNTETTIVRIAEGFALCAVVAWSAVLLLQWLASILAPRALKVLAPAQPGIRATEYLLLLFSPPWAFTTLRI